MLPNRSISTVPRGGLSQTFWRDPALPFVESRRACRSRACYKPHSHPTFSIGAVDEGTSLFTGASHEQVTLRAGTLVLVPASCVHACNPPTDAAWSYQMLHLDAAWLQSVREEYTQAGTGRGDAEPVRILTDPSIYARFCHLNALLFSAADPHDKEAALIELVHDCDLIQGEPIETPRASSLVAAQLQPVLDRLCSAPCNSFALVELAQLASMSRYQLIRAFRAVTGMTPHAWQLNQRINLARERIRAGDSTSDVAYHLGFADQAHFQRVFKAYAGVTPGRFRA
jgi:AraC-like DNA-binding protein